jgi:hypothetical protein
VGSPRSKAPVRTLLPPQHDGAAITPRSEHDIMGNQTQQTPGQTSNNPGQKTPGSDDPTRRVTTPNNPNEQKRPGQSSPEVNDDDADNEGGDARTQSPGRQQ